MESSCRPTLQSHRGDSLSRWEGGKASAYLGSRTGRGEGNAREKEDQANERNSGNDLQTERKPPLESSSGVVLLHSVDGERSEEGSPSEGELLKSGKTTSDRRVRDLTLVQRSEAGERRGQEGSARHAVVKRVNCRRTRRVDR